MLLSSWDLLGVMFTFLFLLQSQRITNFKRMNDCNICRGVLHDLRRDGVLLPGFEKGTFLSVPKLAVIPFLLLIFAG